MKLHESKEIFGAEIQYFRTEPRYWETILDRFKDTGLRCVTTYRGCGPQVSTDLPGGPMNQPRPMSATGNSSAS